MSSKIRIIKRLTTLNENFAADLKKKHFGTVVKIFLSFTFIYRQYSLKIFHYCWFCKAQIQERFLSTWTLNLCAHLHFFVLSLIRPVHFARSTLLELLLFLFINSFLSRLTVLKVRKSVWTESGVSIKWLISESCAHVPSLVWIYSHLTGPVHKDFIWQRLVELEK